METNVLKIKCPNCSGRLTVKLKSPNQDVNIPCPICKVTSPLKSYIKVVGSQQLEHTEYPSKGDETQIGTLEMNYVVGQLKIQDSPLSSYPLKMGRNIVGRKADSSKADIQIPDESQRMSREHLIIDVEKVSGKGIVHKLSLYPKKKINETFLNGEKLSSVDCIPLKHGDVITLLENKLIFEIPDVEATII